MIWSITLWDRGLNTSHTAIDRDDVLCGNPATLPVFICRIFSPGTVARRDKHLNLMTMTDHAWGNYKMPLQTSKLFASAWTNVSFVGKWQIVRSIYQEPVGCPVLRLLLDHRRTARIFRPSQPLWHFFFCNLKLLFLHGPGIVIVVQLGNLRLNIQYLCYAYNVMLNKKEKETTSYRQTPYHQHPKTRRRRTTMSIMKQTNKQESKQQTVILEATAVATITIDG